MKGHSQVSGKTAISRLFSNLIKRTSSPTVVVFLYYLYYLKSLRDMSTQDCIITSCIFKTLISLDIGNNDHVSHSFFILCTLLQSPLMLAYK